MPLKQRPCPCGSGKPYRKCCGKPAAERSPNLASTRLVTLPGGQTMTAAQAIQAAMSLHQEGRLRRAAELYRCVLNTDSKQADALHLLGLTEHQLGNCSAAVDLIQRAITVNPRAAMFHSNLAQVLRAQGKGDEAEAACRRAISLDPALPEAHLNLGGALFLQQRFDDALNAYLRAEQFRPGYSDALLGQGDVLQGAGRYAEALGCYRRVLDLQPGSAAGLTRVGINLARQGRIEEAIAHYETAIKRWPGISELYNNVALLYQRVGRLKDGARSLRRLLELMPADATALHLLAAMEGRTTDRAPPESVRDLFDAYAETFEDHLVRKLGYSTPQKLDEAIRAVSPPDVRWSAVLDLGCGTGLMGEILADRSEELFGVDIAPKMVGKAREKGIYTAVTAIDMLPYLRSREAARFDLVVAADVFVYLGDLAEVFAEAARILRRGALFAFSVEAAPDGTENFVLDHTGRYRHAIAYLRRLAESCDFQVAHLAYAIVRYQGEHPVTGYLCVLIAPD